MLNNKWNEEYYYCLFLSTLLIYGQTIFFKHFFTRNNSTADVLYNTRYIIIMPGSHLVFAHQRLFLFLVSFMSPYVKMMT